MEAFLSVICAVIGFIAGLMFLWDYSAIAGTGGAGRRAWTKAVVKLLIALLALHFHFELDILD